MFSHISIIMYYKNFNCFENQINQDKKGNTEFSNLTLQKTIVFKFRNI